MRPHAAIAALLIATACAGPPPAPVARPVATPPSAAEQTEAERMIARINLHRARQRLAPLRLDARLSRAAQAHSQDMAANDIFGHTGSDGSDIGRRARRAGYDWTRIGENVAAGTARPEEAVDDWMASEGHRRNMLEPAYVDAGVGHSVRDPDPGRLRYRHYWTLMLGAPAPR